MKQLSIVSQRRLLPIHSFFLIDIVVLQKPSRLIFVGAAGPSTNFNPCSASSVPSGSGFKGIDSTNRVTYVECLNYQVLQSYECADGSYFDEQSTQCVTGTWVDPSESTSNVCISTYDGFVAIDSTAYAECFNYSEMGRYSCPDGFFFDQSLQQCTDGNDSVESSTSTPIDPTATSSNVIVASSEPTTIDTTSTTCADVSSGKIPLPSLQGWIVCKDGDVLVTEYCGASKLYSIESGVCVNYCEGNISSNSSLTNVVLLPQLSGQITCDVVSGTPIENIVCSAGTYFDLNLGYCRNFCENQSQNYVSFPDQRGGVTCQSGVIVSVEWCPSGSIYSVIRGVCMQTDAPSLSPTTAHPTRYLVSDAPTISIHVPPTLEPTSSTQPSMDLQLSVPVLTGKGKNPMTGLVSAKESGASGLYRVKLVRIAFLSISFIIGWKDIL
ncbi:hypothetical protein ACHAW6_002431 [Cyclotella cf. meneghiniana]